MNAHRSLTRDDIAHRSPAAIALMVASEFSRASSRCHHRENVLSCYARAQELLGIMETLALTDEEVSLLQPLFKQCASGALLSESHLSPEAVEHLGTHLAEAFQIAAEKISQTKPHA